MGWPWSFEHLFVKGCGGSHLSIFELKEPLSHNLTFKASLFLMQGVAPNCGARPREAGKKPAAPGLSWHLRAERLSPPNISNDDATECNSVLDSKASHFVSGKPKSRYWHQGHPKNLCFSFLGFESRRKTAVYKGAATCRHCA